MLEEKPMASPSTTGRSAAQQSGASTRFPNRSRLYIVVLLGIAVATWVQTLNVRPKVAAPPPTTIPPAPKMPAAHRPCAEAEESAALPWLVQLQRWESKVVQPRESITLITQLSADRLSMLENQCRTWPDVIVAAVYVPILTEDVPNRKKIKNWGALLNSTDEDIILGIDSFHKFMEQTARCTLQIELLGHFMHPDSPEPYPINALRNRALLAAKTDLVFLLDVDFMGTSDLGLPPPGYRDPAVYQELLDLASEPSAIVVPAFEITNRHQDLVMAQNYARSTLMAGKRQMRRHYQVGHVDAFNGHDFPKGHGPTNTSHWAQLPPGSSPYRIKYEQEYEPFVLLARHKAPWFDERFVGYGGNKIAYINQLYGLGFEFYVHPTGYAVHVPHTRTRVANVFVARKRSGNSEMEDLRLRVESSVSSGGYVPVLASCKLKTSEIGKPKTKTKQT